MRGRYSSVGSGSFEQGAEGSRVAIPNYLRADALISSTAVVTMSECPRSETHSKLCGLLVIRRFQANEGATEQQVIGDLQSTTVVFPVQANPSAQVLLGGGFIVIGGAIIAYARA